jgi:hypothetical protein
MIGAIGQDDTMKMKRMTIAAAARQRPTNRSSRAVKSRSAMDTPKSGRLYHRRAWQKSHTARINAGLPGDGGRGEAIKKLIRAPYLARAAVVFGADLE